MQWLANAAVAIALQMPFLLVLGLHFDVLRRHNFALAGGYALGLSVLVWAVRQGAPPLAGVLGAAGAIVLLLLALEFAVYRPMERLGRSADELLVASLGANIVIVQAISVAFGDAVRFFPFGTLGNEPLVTLANEAPSTLAIVCGAVAVGFVYAVYLRSETGLRLRAMGENELLLKSLRFGRSDLVPLLILLMAVGLGLACLGAAGVTGASPNVGFNLVVLGFVARLVGGPVDKPGFAVAAIGVSIFDQAIALLLVNQWRLMILFGALLLLVVARARSPRTAS